MTTIYYEIDKGDKYKIVLFSDDPSYVDRVLDQINHDPTTGRFIEEKDFDVADEIKMNLVDDDTGKIVGELICRRTNLSI